MLEVVIVLYLAVACYTISLAPARVIHELREGNLASDFGRCKYILLVTFIIVLSGAIWPVVHMMDMHDRVRDLEEKS